jgi:hypothetical protein
LTVWLLLELIKDKLETEVKNALDWLESDDRLEKPERLEDEDEDVNGYFSS